MDREGWLDLNLRGMQTAFAAFGHSAGADVIERDGLVAVINRAVPERSVFNSVVYLGHEALAAAYEELAVAYAEAGCAWTVWAPEDDRDTAALLDRNGHTLDAKPRAMGIELDDVPAPDLSDLDWTDADFNYDGTTNTLDFNAIGTNFGLALPAPLPEFGSLVPEPSSLVGCAVACIGVRRRRM